jgi:hypothetical protein
MIQKQAFKETPEKMSNRLIKFYEKTLPSTIIQNVGIKNYAIYSLNNDMLNNPYIGNEGYKYWNEVKQLIQKL